MGCAAFCRRNEEPNEIDCIPDHFMAVRQKVHNLTFFVSAHQIDLSTILYPLAAVNNILVNNSGTFLAFSITGVTPMECRFSGMAIFSVGQGWYQVGELRGDCRDVPYAHRGQGAQYK
jgi:hypothetical protein